MQGLHCAMWDLLLLHMGFPGASVVNLLAMQETQVQSLSRKIPWRRKWQPTPVFLSGKSHAQRSLVGYSRDESDTTELLTTNTFTFQGLSNCNAKA